ncbi:MAG: CHAT domain-containing protein [Anaerolineae bacterium]
MTDLATLEALARQWKKGGLSQAKLAQVVVRARLDRSPAIWDEINAQLDHNPGFGVALARAIQSLATRRHNPAIRTRANLALVHALNVSGEFPEVIQLAEDTVRLLRKSRDDKGVAWAWLEAAWAVTRLGYLDRAKDYIERTRTAYSSDESVQVRANWIAARILREQGAFQEALRCFQHLRDKLQPVNAIEAARLLFEIGHTQARMDPAEAQQPLEQARAFFREENCLADAALCDYILAQALMDLDAFDEARAALGRAQKVFRAHNFRFFDACCNLERGFLLSDCDRFKEALPLFQPARVVFAGMNAAQEVSALDVNIGWALVRLNRYADALPYFQTASETAQSTGRKTKAAVCFVNMGYVYEKQGHYVQALEYLQQARDIFAQAGMSERLVECDLKLGPLYYQLGDLDQALATLNRARKACRSEKMYIKLAQCELHRAHLLLALGKQANARRTLIQARKLFARNGQVVFAAFCDRLQARLQAGNKRIALARLAASRRAFAERGLAVDRALCDLTRAELELQWREWKAARRDLSQAQRVLNKGFPDQKWRIEYAYGKVAEGENQLARARGHYLHAAETIARLRGDLRVESLSDSLFGARQYVMDDALRFTRTHALERDSLYLIETAKAQAFLGHLAVRGWHVPAGQRTRLDALVRHEQELRNQLDEKRAAVAVQTADELEKASAGLQRLRVRSATALADLDVLEHKYEEVATRLRLAPTGLAGTPTLAPFELARFREVAEARWGRDWAALDYYFAKGRLYIGYVDALHIQILERRWSAMDQNVLVQCAATHRDIRELMYRGTLNGAPVPFDGRPFLRQLAELLIPPAILQDRRERTLIISPHKALHQVPFHVLLADGRPLLERFAFLYTPSLQALAQIEASGAHKRKQARWLLCGVQDFAGRADPLDDTRNEIQGLAALAGEKACVWWQKDATREKVIEWNQTRKLRSFDILHLATHAVINPRSPHSSHIMLADRDLTVLDVLDLELNARLVTLSGCSSAEGQAGHGDELLGLARAFLYAGARALVASLWAVEDESTALLMTNFYANLIEGESIAQALRQAQLTLHRQGLAPFQWAPFIALGAA